MRALILILLVPMVGCFESHFGSCTETRACIRVDAIGCCTVGRPSLVAVCDSCPVGTVEVDACRSGGCELLCDEPMECRTDLGAGCCGDVVPGGCEACPAGSVSVDSCTGINLECDCGGMRRFPLPEMLCLREVAGGCCDPSDSIVALPCGCPEGYISEDACSFNGGGPAIDCYSDRGNGCCGAPVESFCGVCPAGSTGECSAVFQEESKDSDGAPQEPPRPDCREDLGDGVCGCVQDFNACGQCFEGSTLDCEFIECDSR